MPAYTEADIDSVLPMVRSIVSKNFHLSHHLADSEDLVSVGVLGALEAAPRWDPEAGAAFTSFVYFRAYGAIRDYLRSIQTGTRRDPNRYDVLSLDVQVKRFSAPSDAQTLASLIPAEEIELVDPYLRGILAEAMADLSPEARLALWLAFCENETWTRKDIGEVIGRSEAATYQFIHNALKRLREHPDLQDYSPDGPVIATHR